MNTYHGWLNSQLSDKKCVKHLRFPSCFQILFFFFGLICSRGVFCQDWSVTKSISVGESPERAVLTPNAAELYVSNRLGGTVSVIDTATNRVISTLKVGSSPGTLVASHDGKRVYVLVENGLVIINTAAKTELKYIPLPGRTDELALTHDDKRLYLARVYYGVFYLDTSTEELRQATQDTCPIGIAVSNDDRRMYVNYQCYGPGGALAQDAIGVYELPSHKLIQAITGLANVGGQVALSPDGTQLWADGNDACSRPDYPQTGCQRFPSRVMNVISTADLKLLKSYEFSLEDFDGRISFSPDGKVFIGSGIFLKEIPVANLTDLADVKRLPVANVGDVVFAKDGMIAYVTVSDKNTVFVMKRVKQGGAADYGEAAELSLLTIANALSDHSNYGRCIANGQCVRITPQAMAPVVAERGRKSIPQCGSGPKQGKLTSTDIYRCVANAVLQTLTPTDQAIDLAMNLRALQSNEDYLQWKIYNTKRDEAGRLSNKMPRTPEEEKLLADLKRFLENQDHDTRSFNDITLRLYDQSLFQKSLGDSAVALIVFSWGEHVYTVFLSQSEKILQEDLYAGKRLDSNTLETKALDFQNKLQNRSGDLTPPGEAGELYAMLIGNLDKKLKAYRALAPSQNLTLLWLTDGALRNIPMAALFDGQQYLVSLYGNAMLTNPGLSSANGKRGDWSGLVAGTSRGGIIGNEYFIPNPGLSEELHQLFPGADSQGQSTIQAKFLLDSDFTANALSTALHQLSSDERSNRFVYIASHFFLGSDANKSFLFLGDTGSDHGLLTLQELNSESRFPLVGFDLVTFMACRTAARGQAFESLAFDLDQRGNGAHAVVAPLWSVNLDHVMPLMKVFYAELQRGVSKAEALRRAELSLLQGQDDEMHLPYYWAPFILSGDWN